MTGGLVISLGPVGGNFGAGMTGGLAYLYGVTSGGCRVTSDGAERTWQVASEGNEAGTTGQLARSYEAEDARTRVNPQLVTLTALDEDDEACLRAWLDRHRALTGSPRATALLADWPTHAAQFVRVAPKDGPLPPRPIPVELNPRAEVVLVAG
jgi:glutamate synthase (NADPH/NADH) large chain